MIKMRTYKKPDGSNAYISGMLSGCKGDVITFINNFLNKNSRYISISRHEDNLHIRGVYYADAWPSNGDRCSETTGKNIAKYRVLNKYYKNFDAKIYDFLYDIFSVSMKLLVWCLKNTKHTYKVIDKLNREFEDKGVKIEVK